MQEVWKDVVGYEGLYRVSNLGRVKSLRRLAKNRYGYRPIKERILKQSPDKGGYPSVNLFISGIPKTHKVHKLVALAFIPNPDNKPCINHINSKRDDNRLINLEWCTYSENAKHAYDTNEAPRGSNHHNSRVTESDVLQVLEMLYQNVKQRDIGKILGIHPQIVNDIHMGRTWTHVSGKTKQTRKTSPGGRYKYKKR